MIDPDRFYSARDFADLLGVHHVSIYQSQQHLAVPKLAVAVPPAIRIGRSVRWSGSQILEYMRALARSSGVVLPRVESVVSVAPARGRGRPRKQFTEGGAV